MGPVNNGSSIFEKYPRFITNKTLVLTAMCLRGCLTRWMWRSRAKRLYLALPFFKKRIIVTWFKTKKQTRITKTKLPQWFKSLHSSNGKQNLYLQICTTPESKWPESIILPYLKLTKQHCYFPLDSGK